ncbi:MAG: 2Fe-2S iron-sulfur cluster binding domain-containing protein [Comamonadaceae bacterium]|nr:MAG: 2Fe-2S iron-sulfur cluster binding domain-containing protein [Comamonadaceae bacterium]
MKTIPITLLFADGVTHQLQASEGQKLVEAAEGAGLSLLTDCGNGQCGTCAAQRVSGAVTMDDYDTSVLPDEDRDSGAILCCVARASGPCIIELPYDASEASAGEPPARRGRVYALERVAEETMRLEVDVDSPLDFLAGQYVRIRPEGQAQWRSYSMANASGATRLVFYVRIVPGGMFSRWLETAAAPGAVMEIGAPRGSFFLRDEARPRLFVAGGTGLAPFLAMLRAMDAGASSPVPTRLLIGVRSGSHFFAEDEITALKARMPALQVEYAAESGAPLSGNACHAGFATDLIASGMDPATRIYLCGPPPMVEAGRDAAARAGIRKADVLCERFA